MFKKNKIIFYLFIIFVIPFVLFGISGCGKEKFITYSVTYELNGGVNNDDNLTQFSSNGASFVLKDPTRDNYTFEGWYLNSNFEGNKITKVGATYFKRDIKLYAKWNANVYEINYELNGGQNNQENPETHTYGVETELKNPSKFGYSFDGWYLNENYDESTKVDVLSPNGYTSNITLYAKYSPIKTYAIFKVNGGTFEDNSTNDKQMEVYFDQVFGELPMATKENRVFLGWFSVRYDDDEEVDETKKITAQSIVKNVNDTTYYACYRSYVYNVQFVYDDGQEEPKVISTSGIKSGDSFLVPSIEDFGLSKYVKPGYIWQAWVGNSVEFYIPGNSGVGFGPSEDNETFVFTAKLRMYLKFSLFDTIDENTLSAWIIGLDLPENHNLAITKIDIPSEIYTEIGDSMKIIKFTTIEQKAFSNLDSLTNVTIGDGITKIGSEAFFDCDGLKYVDMSNSSVETIGKKAFFACNNLEEVKFSNCVQLIDTEAFSYCTNFQNITLPNSLQTINQHAFSHITNNYQKRLIIPNSVTTLGKQAFLNLGADAEIDLYDEVENREYDGRKVVISNQLTAIESQAFGSANVGEIDFNNAPIIKIKNHSLSNNKLKTISLPNTLQYIYDHAMSGNAFSSITIPSSVLEIGVDAFTDHLDGSGNPTGTINYNLYNKSNDETFDGYYLPKTNTNGEVINPYYFLVSLGGADPTETNFKICNDTKFIASELFDGFVEKNSVEDSHIYHDMGVYSIFYSLARRYDNAILAVKKIAPNNGYGISDLTRIVFPEYNIGAILANAINCDDNFEFISFPETIDLSIGNNKTNATVQQDMGTYKINYVLYEKNNQIVLVVKNVKSKKEDENDVSEITDIRFPDCTYGILNYALENFTGLETLYIPAHADLSIGNTSSWPYNTGIISGCTNIKNITGPIYMGNFLPDGATDVNLHIIGIETLKYESFYNNDTGTGYLQLKTISFDETFEEMGYHTFYKCTNLESVTVFNNKNITFGNNAFHDCSKLRYIEHNLNYKLNLGDDCFWNCTSLEYIILTQNSAVGTTAFDSCYGLRNVYFSSDVELAISISGNGPFLRCRAQDEHDDYYASVTIYTDADSVPSAWINLDQGNDKWKSNTSSNHAWNNVMHYKNDNLENDITKAVCAIVFPSTTLEEFIMLLNNNGYSLDNQGYFVE